MRGTLTAVLAVAAMALAGCSDGGAAAPLPTAAAARSGHPGTATGTTTGRSTAAAPVDPSVVWRAPPPPDAAAAEVLLAYRRYWTVAQRLFRTPNPNDPTIASVAAGPARDQLVRTLRNAAAAGIHDRGVVVFRPTVMKVSPGAASVADCVDSTGQADYDVAGRMVPKSNGRRFRVRFDLTRSADGTRWIVFQRRDVSGAC